MYNTKKRNVILSILITLVLAFSVFFVAWNISPKRASADENINYYEITATYDLELNYAYADFPVYCLVLDDGCGYTEDFFEYFIIDVDEDLVSFGIGFTGSNLISYNTGSSYGDNVVLVGETLDGVKIFKLSDNHTLISGDAIAVIYINGSEEPSDISLIKRVEIEETQAPEEDLTETTGEVQSYRSRELKTVLSVTLLVVFIGIVVVFVLKLKKKSK